MSYSDAQMMGTAVDVSAAPCVTRNITAGGNGQGGGALKIVVTAATDLNLTSIFNCAGGEFEVDWSGAVNVPGTIHVGVDTTVKIVGNGSVNNSDGTAPNTGGSNITGSSDNSSSQDQLDVYTAPLSIPRGLTSAVVGVGSSAASDKSSAFGPIFFVNGGQLFLENMAIREGFVANYTHSSIISGGGIHALDANVTVTGCEFENNFAEFWGGGIFVNRSTLVVVDTVFRNCSAGLRAAAGEDAVDGAGGAIGVNPVSSSKPPQCPSCY